MIMESEAASALPQENLVEIACGVDHKDLKQLFHVSKAIREATLIAKQCHFAYTTPSKTPAFRTFSNSDLDEIEAPDAPKQCRLLQRPLPSRNNNLADLSLNLFASASSDEEKGTGKGKGLFIMDDEYRSLQFSEDHFLL